MYNITRRHLPIAASNKMDSQSPPSDYSLDNISVIITFFSILPLFFFIVFFVIEHCYQRLRHGSGLDPELPDLEAGQGSLTRPPSPSTTAADHNRHNLGQFRNKIGTHRLMLPVDRDYDSSTTNIRECAICLEEFRAGETCRVLLVCDHFFHPECIGLWLVENQTCPICRREVFWQSN